MIRRPPRSTRTDTLLPYTTLFRSKVFSHVAACRSAAPALYPTPGIGPQPCTPASCICPYFPSPAPCGVLFSLTTTLSGTRRFPPVAARRAAHDRIRTPDPCRPAARAERGHVLRRQGRSEERRVGNTCVSQCRFRGAPSH